MLTKRPGGLTANILRPRTAEPGAAISAAYMAIVVDHIEMGRCVERDLSRRHARRFRQLRRTASAASPAESEDGAQRPAKRRDVAPRCAALRDPRWRWRGEGCGATPCCRRGAMGRAGAGNGHAWTCPRPAAARQPRRIADSHARRPPGRWCIGKTAEMVHGGAFWPRFDGLTAGGSGFGVQQDEKGQRDEGNRATKGKRYYPLSLCRFVPLSLPPLN